MPRLKITLSVSFLALLLILSAASATAQDAGQVLRTWVGFRTVKNTAKLSDEAAKQVAQLEAKATTANGEKRYGDAIKYLSQGMALMRNQPWTPARALATATEFKADRVILDPGDTVKLKLSQIFTLDEPVAGKLNGSLTLTQAKEGKQEPLKELRNLKELPPDFTMPLSLDAKIPEVADGPYQLLLKLTPATGEPLTKIINVRVARGLNAQAAALKSRAAEVRSDLQKRKPDRLPAAMPGVEYAASLVELSNTGMISLGRGLKSEIAQASADLDLIAKGENPLRAKRADLRSAYRSAVDDTLQPFRMYIPTNYDAGRKWPMVVALHGMGGDENSFFTAYKDGEIRRIAESRGYILVCPKGRGPTSMYLGSAEKDVLDVIGEMKREYAIDNDRVYLMGHSMGGYGTWSITVNHPELFAAIAPIAGGGNPIVMAKMKGATQIPQLVTHGDKDPTVSVEESRKMVKVAQDLGIKVKYNEVPGGDHSNVVVPAFPQVFDWFDAHKRQPKGAAAGNRQ